jgi:hypothetical protein
MGKLTGQIKDMDLVTLAETVEQIYNFIEKWTNVGFNNLELYNNSDRQKIKEEWQTDFDNIGIVYVVPEEVSTIQDSVSEPSIEVLNDEVVQ